MIIRTCKLHRRIHLFKSYSHKITLNYLKNIITLPQLSINFHSNISDLLRIKNTLKVPKNNTHILLTELT